MTQYARPASDITVDSWTTSPLYSKVNDSSDSTYITGPSGATTQCEVKLGSVTDPQGNTGHILTVRAKVASGSGQAEQLTAYLYEGATLRATAALGNISRTTITDYSYTLTAGQTDSLTAYNDLRVRLAQTQIGTGETINVYDIYLAVPDAVVTQTGSFPAAAIVFKTTGTGFSTDSIRLRSTALGFASDALKSRTFGYTFATDATKAWVKNDSLPADAIVAGAIHTPVFDSNVFDVWVFDAGGVGSFTIDAWFYATRFTLDAFVAPPTVEGTFTVDAEYGLPKVFGSFRADAVRRATMVGGPLASAIIRWNRVPTPFTVDAWTVTHGSGTFTVGAWRAGRVLLDAVIVGGTRVTEVIVDVVVAPTSTQAQVTELVTDVVIGNWYWFFPAGAWFVRQPTSSFATDAWVAGHGGWVNLDAYIGARIFASFGVGAWIKVPGQWFLYADALIELRPIRRSDLTIDSTVVGEAISFLRSAFNPDAFPTGDALIAESEVILDYGLAPLAASALILDYALTSSPTSDLVIDAPVAQTVDSDLELDAGIEYMNPVISLLTLDWAIEPRYRTIIRYDGIDITDDVLFRDCMFRTRAGGDPGTAQLYIRRPAGTYHGFLTGKTLELLIDGDYVWRGWTTRVNSRYPFSYDRTDGLVAREQFVYLEGTDINELFVKRIVFKQGDETAGAPEYKGTYTPDITALRDLFDHWLDLSGDGLDTTTLVDHVGYLNIDQPARPIVPSSKWGQTMAMIAAMPGAIFYINPDKQVVYCDVDTPTAPYGLSDTPEADGAAGYRELRLTLDASQLANDYMVWGITGAQSRPVFERLTDALSIEQHGVWQNSDIRHDLYRPATLDQVVRTYLFGSPTNKRGHKDPQPYLRCKTYASGFRVAQKVSFMSHAHGFSDVLPIRELTVTFPATSKEPLYELLLAHEIDSLSFADVIRIPPLTIGPLPPVYEPPTQGASPGIVIDSFSRVVLSPHVGAWGSGEETDWVMGLSAPYAGVDSGSGYMVAMWPEREPDWTLYQEGMQNAGTGVPWLAREGPHQGEHIDMRNLLIRFSLDRYIRIFPAHVITAYWSNGTWPNPQYTVDTFIQGWYETGGLGRTDGNVPDHMNVSSEFEDYFITWGIDVPPDSYIDRVVVAAGGFPEGWSYEWSLGGGLLPWYWTYAGYSSTAFGAWLGNEITFAYHRVTPSAPGYPWYVPGTSLGEVLFAGPDTSSVEFNQWVNVGITTGSGTIRIRNTDQPAKDPYEYIPQGPSGGVYSVRDDKGGFGGAKYITPGLTYNMRIYQPNDHMQLVKIWGDHEGSEHGQIWLSDWREAGWDDPDAPEPSYRAIHVFAQMFPLQTYILRVDHIESYPGTYGENDLLPLAGVVPLPPGTQRFELQWLTASGGTDYYTSYGYIPGSLTVYLNGTIQRSGIDFIETDPASGLFSFTTAPEVGDNFIVEYYTQ